jgi:hypothetical protein
VNTNLATANWVTPAESVTDNGTIKYIIVHPPSGKRFYRLNKSRGQSLHAFRASPPTRGPPPANARTKTPAPLR